MGRTLWDFWFVSPEDHAKFKNEGFNSIRGGSKHKPGKGSLVSYDSNSQDATLVKGSRAGWIAPNVSRQGVGVLSPLEQLAQEAE